MIKTIDNFIASDFEFNNKIYKINDNYYFGYSRQSDLKDLNITLSDFKSKNIQILSFFDSKDDKRDDEELIISIKKDEDKYTAKTGNFIGKFTFNGLDIEIGSRFSEEFLKRMLNFANDVYLDDVDVAGEKAKELDFSRFIIFYMFVQKLEKAFLLGLPKAYTTIKHHDIKVRGKIDINRFIKHDIPFRGKVSSTSREQKEIQEIIDILHKAVSIISKSSFSTKNISHIKTHLKQHKSNRFVSNETFTKALNSKALQNPIFAPYKSVLKYAKMIINLDSLENNNKGKEKTFGFVIDVSKLFELYLIKLLRLHFGNEWEVIHEDEQRVYKDNFYARRMFPDIVLKKDNKVMVFDAKYKRMKFDEGIGDGKYGDLDRSDFFQIHTYMSYYQNNGDKVIAGGLLYPMEGDFEKNKCHSQGWLGNSEVKFIVDGIVLSKEDTDTDKKLSEKQLIKSREDDFIGRLEKIN
jgi:5-methylcytosine-specific restriction endonuclease McrBC regulatory subunit McrC